MNDKKIKTYIKRADLALNKIIIPKLVIDNFGREFFIEVDIETGVMKLTPLSQMKKGE